MEGESGQDDDGDREEESKAFVIHYLLCAERLNRVADTHLLIKMLKAKSCQPCCCLYFQQEWKILCSALASFVFIGYIVWTFHELKTCSLQMFIYFNHMNRL